jgi:type II secretory pathway pseudopilin PulG
MPVCHSCETAQPHSENPPRGRKPAAKASNARGGADVTRTRTGGFTLVELIVAISITLIIISVTMTILISSMNISSRSIKTSQGEQVVNACLDFVLDHCSVAESISQSSGTDLSALIGSTKEFLYIGNESGPQDRGHLYLRTGGTGGVAPLDAYGEQFYSGGSISLDITYTRIRDQHPVVTATVTLYDTQGSTVARKQRSLALLNGNDSPDDLPYDQDNRYVEDFPTNDAIIVITPPATTP